MLIDGASKNTESDQTFSTFEAKALMPGKGTLGKQIVKG